MIPTGRLDGVVGWSGCRMLSGVNRRIFEGWAHFAAVDRLPTRLVVASLVHR
jgi:hypothetical protein